jgi:hypothetical protein
LEKKVYDRFRERKIQRWKAFIGYVFFFIIVIAVGTYAHYNAEWFMSYCISIGILGSLIGFFYLVSRPWATENYETSIFVDIYDASKLLELVSDEDENSHFYSKKASKKLEEAILHIGSLAYKLEQVNSTLANKKFVEPLRNLEKNLETRILPRVSKHNDVQGMISVLHGLAKIFGEIVKPLSLEEIVSKNKDLERFETIDTKKEPNRFRTMLSKEPIKLSYDILLGLIVIFGAVFVHSVFYKYSLTESLSNLTNFLEVLGVGVAVGIGIYGIRIVNIRRE